MSEQAEVRHEHAAAVEREIADHPNWCSPRCRMFHPQAYREKRQRYNAATVQGDYDLCHVFR